MTIRTLLVDDEPPARRWVRRELDAQPDIEVVGERGDGLSAVAAIEELSPHLVILDVQMPGLDGFGVLETVGADRMPAVIFVTAFDRYAVKAFETHAVDYVLKPFAPERLREALQRARSRLATPQLDALRDSLRALAADLPAPRPRREWVLVRSGEESRFVRIADIDWIESSRNNVLLHVGREVHVVRGTMASLEESLDPERFLRIHRGTIVSIARIKAVQAWFNGEHRIVLTDGTELTMSATYRSRLRELRRFGLDGDGATER